MGLTQAGLRLKHPGYDRSRSYSATVAKEFLAQSEKSEVKKAVDGEVSLGIGAKLAQILSFRAIASAKASKLKSATQDSKAPYSLISATPFGWQIGSELGDPRPPTGDLPADLENCLNGEYFSGRAGEDGDGFKDDSKEKTFHSCRLETVPGGNDPNVTAVLFGIAGALKIAVTRKPGSVTPDAHRRDQAEADEMKATFIRLCLDKAAQQDAKDDLLRGEFFLHRLERGTPKLSPAKPTTGATKVKPT